MTMIRDTLKLARKWRETGLESGKADQMVIALNEELESGDIATKNDLKDMEIRLTWRIATMLIAQVGVLFALMKFFP
jgi:hypothetical protein